MVFPLWAPCEPNSCPHRLNLEKLTCFKMLQELLLEVIMRKGPKPQTPSQEPLVLEAASPTTRASSHVVVAYNTRKKPIAAVLIKLKLLGPEDVPRRTLACEKGGDGQLAMLSDSCWCLELASAASDWNLSILQVAAVRKLHLFDIVGLEPVDFSQSKSSMQKEKESKLAMDAMRLLNFKPKAPSKRKASGSRPAAGTGKGSAKRKVVDTDELC